MSKWKLKWYKKNVKVRIIMIVSKEYYTKIVLVNKVEIVLL